MGLIVRLLVFMVLGAVLGAVSALWIAGFLPNGPRLGSTINIEGWASDWSIGSKTANPYVRARIARHGLLALTKEEAVYFTKAEDDEGAPLREDCIYRVSGGTLPAEWWSITLYDADSRLPMNTDGKLSLDQSQADFIFESPEAWWFQVSSIEPEDYLMPWVSSRNAGRFDLMLRLYRPTEALLEAPESTLVPPAIEKLSCNGEAS